MQEVDNRGEVLIRLDLKHGEIRFSLNGIDQGIAFKNIKQGKDIKYRLVGKMYHKEASIEIVQFCRL